MSTENSVLYSNKTKGVTIIVKPQQQSQPQPTESANAPQKKDHILCWADGNIRAVSENGINYIQNASKKSILRFSPMYSALNIIEFGRNAINIGDQGNQNAVDLNLVNGSLNIKNGSLMIGDKQMLDPKVSDSIVIDTTNDSNEVKVSKVIDALVAHGLISIK